MCASGLELRPAREGEQGTRVAHLDLTPFQEALDLSFQIQEPQEVAHRGARAAHGLGDLLVGHPELLDQFRERRGLFEWAQVLALDVFDERDAERGRVRDVADQGRYSVQTGEPRRAPAPFAGDELVAVAPITQGTHHHGLHHPLRPDRVRQLLQTLGAQVPPRLIAALADPIDGDVLDRPRRRRLFQHRIPGHTQ